MNKKPVNIDEQRTEALAASLSSTGLDAFSVSRFLKLLAEGGSAGLIKFCAGTAWTSWKKYTANKNRWI